MTTALLTHVSGLAHVTPPGHPEQVARLEAIHAALAAPEFAGLRREEPPVAEDADILRCHPQAYLDKVWAAIPAGADWHALDGDTHLCAGSEEPARRGVGGNLPTLSARLLPPKPATGWPRNSGRALPALTCCAKWRTRARPSMAALARRPPQPELWCHTGPGEIPAPRPRA